MSNKSYLGQATLPRGLRNNNPGNLIKTSIAWQGKIPHNQNTDARFEQFYELRYGIRAMMLDIINDFSTKGKKTISALIHEYAPAFENNTTGYINAVAAGMGITASTVIEKLTRPILLGLAREIINVENGAIAKTKITAEDIAAGYAILGRTLPEAQTFLEKKK